MKPSYFTRSQLLLGKEYIERLLPKRISTQQDSSEIEKFSIDLDIAAAKFTEGELLDIVDLFEKLSKEYM